MRAGLLNDSITIIESVLSVNDFGEQEETWKPKYKARARLIHLGGGRQNINEEIFYSSNKTFETRIYVPVDFYNRVIWNGNIYRILDIIPDREQQKLTIKAELVDD